MINKRAFLISSSYAFLAACVPNANNRVDSSLYVKRQYSDEHNKIIARALIEKKFAQLNYVLNDAPMYKELGISDIKFDSDKELVANGTKITLKSNTVTGFYPSGEYRLTSARNKKAGVLFTRIAADFINRIKSELDAQLVGIKYSIVATFTGEADAQPITNRIIYDGEYGHVNVGMSQAHLNGREHTFQIKINQQITNNADLALLRAYGFNHFFKKSLGMPYTDRYKVITHDNTGNVGEMFRRAKIELVINY